MPENSSPAAAATIYLICFKNWMANIFKTTRSEILNINEDFFYGTASLTKEKCLLKVFYILCAPDV